MTSTDAAALSLMMLGHTGGISPKLTADRVRQLWRTTGPIAPLATWSASISEEMNAKLAIESLRFVKDIEQTLLDFAKAKRESCTFGECLAALIDDCISGRMRTFLDKHGGVDRQKFNLKIEIPDLVASIEFANVFDEHDTTGWPITLEVAYQFSGVVDHDRNREITTTQEMTVLPLLRIAKAFGA
jgi:hypothetical protein